VSHSSPLVSGLLRALAIVFVAVLVADCGGGGGGGSSSPPPSPPAPSGANVAPIVVDGGTDGAAFNTPFVSVTVCQPGTSTCATIDHVVVDTGSFGLRLAASAVPAAIALPQVTAPGGASLGECAPFASGFAWGSVRTADVAIAGERANAIPIQLIDDPTTGFGTPPTSCSNIGPNIRANASDNGILGVGFAAQDCGPACASSPPPAVYFACTAAGCAPAAAPLASQVVNPVAGLPVDNNGVAIVLPAVPLGGVSSLAGSLIFGIGTQANNQPSAVQTFTVDRQGNFTTTYKGANLAAFIDSGSNGIFFPDSSFPRCSGSFYCPASPQTLSATISSPNGNSAAVDFFVESVNALPATTTAGHAAGDAGALGFDWGLPFFFGRTVWTGIAGTRTPLGTGPLWAF
jgi:hypothetical protein